MIRGTVSVPEWAKATLALAVAITIALLGVMFHAVEGIAPGADALPQVVIGVVVVTVATTIWTLETSSVSVWARMAVVLTAAQLAIAIGAWFLWRNLSLTSDLTASLPLVTSLPAPAVALGLGGVVLAVALLAPRRRRTAAPRWLHGVVVFALAYLFLLSCWMPMVATQAPAMHTIHVDVRPWIDGFVPWVLVPPAVVALAIAAVYVRRPAWTERHRRRVTTGVVIAVLLALVGAVGARIGANPGPHWMYGNFVHVLLAAATFALMSLTALAGSHARALAANRVDTHRPAPWTQEGVVVVADDADPVVGQIVDGGLLGGIHPAVGAFVLRTEDGDLPVSAGARLGVALPATSQSARAGDRAPVLRAGDRVTVTGFVAPADAGPFRGSSLLQPGPGGLVVTIARQRLETIARDVLLLLWRPCVLFLIVAALSSIPGLAGSHAPYQTPTDLDTLVP